MARLFLSYSRRDYKIAKQIADDLKAAGIAIWVDMDQIYVGDSFVKRIAKGISAIDFFAILISHHSMNSQWVQKELNLALVKSLDSKSITILPMLFDDTEMPELIRDLQFADFRYSYKEGFSALLKVLKDVRRTDPNEMCSNNLERTSKASGLHLVDIHAIQEIQSDCAFPIFDFKLINTGYNIVFLTQLDVEILQVTPKFRSGRMCAPISVSEQYNVMLSPVAVPGIKTIKISHALGSNEVDRFQVRIGSTPRWTQHRKSLVESVSFKVKFHLRYNGDQEIETQPFTFRIKFEGAWNFREPSVIFPIELSGKLKALQHEDPKVRLDAVNNLALIGDKSAIPALIQLFSDQDTTVMFTAAIVAGKLGAKEALSFLTEWLERALLKKNEHMIAEIVSSIVHINDETVPEFLYQKLAVLIDLHTKDNYSRYAGPIKAIIDGLGFLNKLPYLQNLLSSDCSLARLLAVEQIGRIGGVDNVKKLLDALCVETNGQVVYQIIDTLRISGDETVVPALENTLLRIKKKEIEQLSSIDVLHTIEYLRYRVISAKY